MGVEVSYCIVCTEQRERLLACLDAVAAERGAVGFETEVLVLDNASTDGSAAAARAHPSVDAVVALSERTGKAANDSALLERAGGRLCLLLNEDSEVRPGATAALRDALDASARKRSPPRRGVLAPVLELSRGQILPAQQEQHWRCVALQSTQHTRAEIRGCSANGTIVPAGGPPGGERFAYGTNNR